jgi:phosphomannomutase/phosphoglucomutase
LAAFYPACRQCEHRDETGTLSPRQIEQLQEVALHRRPGSMFHDEGVGGVYLNDFSPVDARNVAGAFAESVNLAGEPSLDPNSQSRGPHPSILLAGDNRSITAELTAAVAEGVRAGGCDVMDIGPSTSPCLALAVRDFRAAGGIMVGNSTRQPHVVDMQFWSAEAMPLSMGGSLERIVERYQAGAGRRSPVYGQVQRHQAESAYLAALGALYHALRPLRVIVDSASRPIVQYFQRLAASVACRVAASRVARHELPGHVRAESAHFAVGVDGNGETCEVLDERGQVVPNERLLILLARSCASKKVIVEQGTFANIVERMRQAGCEPISGGACRWEMAAAMRDHGSAIGGGRSGRFWHPVAGIPLPDALMTITRLLVVLSRSDEPLSVVLDREASVD